MTQYKEYPPLEEKINVWSHSLGALLSIIGLLLLLLKTNSSLNQTAIISLVIYGLSMIILYSVSALYHNAKKPLLRSRLRVLDHASIYVLIAGTYTPFTLITLQGAAGWIVFSIVWIVAIIGILLKLYFTGRFSKASTIMYVSMGWIVVFVLKPLIENLETAGLVWLFTGGLFYTLGAVIYGLNRMNFNHATFHICVLLGSICHYLAVFFYVLD